MKVVAQKTVTVQAPGNRQEDPNAGNQAEQAEKQDLTGNSDQ